MSNRFNGLLVTLDIDLHEEDAGLLIKAIKQMRHVVEVRGHVADFGTAIAEARVRRELMEKLFGVLREKQ
jgi:hypothetical protein